MSNYRSPLVSGEIYHVFNRSVANESIFNSLRSLRKILDIIDYYRFDQDLSFSVFSKLKDPFKKVYLARAQSLPIVDIYAFSMMPNHYHLQIKQLKKGGISKFISKVQNSFARYHNLKLSRNGSLFQNSFKAKIIRTDEEFIHVSRYIHLNHVTSRLIEFNQLLSHPWSSLSWYVKPKLNRFVNMKPLLSHFGSLKRYLEFLENQVDYQRKLKKIKSLLLD